LDKDREAKNRGHLAAFALLSLAEKVSPGGIDRAGAANPGATPPR
jgi:hypothetical protein